MMQGVSRREKERERETTTTRKLHISPASSNFGDGHHCHAHRNYPGYPSSTLRRNNYLDCITTEAQLSRQQPTTPRDPRVPRILFAILFHRTSRKIGIVRHFWPSNIAPYSRPPPFLFAIVVPRYTRVRSPVFVRDAFASNLSEKVRARSRICNFHRFVFHLIVHWHSYHEENEFLAQRMPMRACFYRFA